MAPSYKRPPTPRRVHSWFLSTVSRANHLTHSRSERYNFGRKPHSLHLDCEISNQRVPLGDLQWPAMEESLSVGLHSYDCSAQSSLKILGHTFKRFVGVVGLHLFFSPALNCTEAAYLQMVSGSVGYLVTGPDRTRPVGQKSSLLPSRTNQHHLRAALGHPSFECGLNDEFSPKCVTFSEVVYTCILYMDQPEFMDLWSTNSSLLSSWRAGMSWRIVLLKVQKQ